jgi:hypothetical protein
VALSTVKLKEWLAADLSGLDLLVIQIEVTVGEVAVGDIGTCVVIEHADSAMAAQRRPMPRQLSPTHSTDSLELREIVALRSAALVAGTTTSPLGLRETIATRSRDDARPFAIRKPIEAARVGTVKSVCRRDGDNVCSIAVAPTRCPAVLADDGAGYRAERS